VTEAGTSKLGGDPGLHNKPLGCGASEVYASGPPCEEEEVRGQVHTPTALLPGKNSGELLEPTTGLDVL